MIQSSPRLLVLVTVLSLMLAGIPSAAVAADLAVSTGNATDVTETTATLHGNLTSTEPHGQVNVSFEYWVEGDFANASTTTAETLAEPAEFNTSVSGLEPNTTYVFRASAEADGTTVTGRNVTFTTEARPASPTSFGLELVSYIRSLGGEDIIGPAVANYSTSNNPGSDNGSDEAGPPGWLMDEIVGSSGGGPGAQAQDSTGPPEHAGNASDTDHGPENPGSSEGDTADDEGEDEEDNPGKGRSG